MSHNIYKMNEKIYVVGSGCCRGDRWAINFSDTISGHKLLKVFDEQLEEDALNDVESYVYFGDCGFVDEGVDKFGDRFDRLKSGEVVIIEREEEWVAMGQNLDDCYREYGKSELEYLKGIL